MPSISPAVGFALEQLRSADLPAAWAARHRTGPGIRSCDKKVKPLDPVLCLLYD
jgi:hypothetical protein